MAVRSRVSKSFRKLLAALPADQQALARARFNNFFLVDHRHPALRGKMVPDKMIGCTVWRIDAGGNYRAAAIVREVGEDIFYDWYWIGTHEAYNGRL